MMSLYSLHLAMKLSFPILSKVFSVGAILAVGTMIGYVVAARTGGIVFGVSEDPLIKISYSGGMLLDEENATQWKAIYSDGRVVKMTRGGEEVQLPSITASQVVALREMINAPDFIDEEFPKKEREFCESYVDGIDTEIQFTRDDGTHVSYSDCEYDLSEDSGHILTLVSFLTRVISE